MPSFRAGGVSSKKPLPGSATGRTLIYSTSMSLEYCMWVSCHALFSSDGQSEVSQEVVTPVDFAKPRGTWGQSHGATRSSTKAPLGLRGVDVDDGGGRVCWLSRKVTFGNSC